MSAVITVHNCLRDTFKGTAQHDGSGWKYAHSIGVFIKERGAKVFRKIRPSPILREPLKGTAPPRTAVGYLNTNCQWRIQPFIHYIQLVKTTTHTHNYEYGQAPMVTGFTYATCHCFSLLGHWTQGSLLAEPWGRDSAPPSCNRVSFGPVLGREYTQPLRLTFL